MEGVFLFSGVFFRLKNTLPADRKQEKGSSEWKSLGFWDGLFGAFWALFGVVFCLLFGVKGGFSVKDGCEGTLIAEAAIGAAEDEGKRPAIKKGSFRIKAPFE